MTDKCLVRVNTNIVERADDLFGLLSTLVRLRIILELRAGDRSIGELLAGAREGQMYRAGLVACRKQGAQVYNRIANESVVSACRIVCAQVALTVTRGMRFPFRSAARPAHRE